MIILRVMNSAAKSPCLFSADLYSINFFLEQIFKNTVWGWGGEQWKK